MKDFRNTLKSNHLNDNFDDWNDEEIWIEIERRLPRKRKRKFFFWIFGGAMIFVLGLFSLVSSGNEIEEISTYDENEQLQISQNVKSIDSTEHSELLSATVTSESQNTSAKNISIVNQEVDLIEANLSSLDIGHTAAPNESGTLAEPTKNATPLNLIETETGLVGSEHLVRLEGKNGRLSNTALASLEGTVDYKFTLHLSMNHVSVSDFQSPALLKEVATESTVKEETMKTRRPVDQIIRIPLQTSMLPMTVPEIDRLKVILPTERKNYPLIFSLVGGGGAFDKNVISDLPELLELSGFRKRLEMPEYSAHVNLRLEKQITQWGLGVYGGLTYNQYNERIFHQYRSVTQSEVFTDRAFFIRDQDGSRFFIAGNRIQIITVSGELNRYNETRILKMPFGVNFVRSIGTLKVGLNLGTAISIFNKASGDIVLLDNRLITKNIFGESETNPLKLYGVQAGLQLRYPISTKLGLVTALNYETDRFRFIGQNEMQENFSVMHLGLGITWDLK